MFERFYLCVKNMADICVSSMEVADVYFYLQVPQEYGIQEDSKISIAQRVCTPLLTKIRSDLHRCVQVSLYWILETMQLSFLQFGLTNKLCFNAAVYSFNF